MPETYPPMGVPQMTKRDGSPMPVDTARRLQSVFTSPHFMIPKPRIDIDDITKSQALKTEKAPRVPWDKFITEKFDWRPGEHVTMIGPTGEGKTTAMLGIMPIMPYTVILGTKPADATLDNLQNDGYLKLERWRAIDPTEYPRRLLWPDSTDLDSTRIQSETFGIALKKMFRERSWAIAADETAYLSEQLGLGKEIRLILIQGRSLNISMVCATQRPSRIPLECYSQATHLFLWKIAGKEDVDRLRELNGRVDPRVIKEIMNGLERFQFLYVNTRTGYMCRTRAPKIEEVTHGNRS